MTNTVGGFKAIALIAALLAGAGPALSQTTTIAKPGPKLATQIAKPPAKPTTVTTPAKPQVAATPKTTVIKPVVTPLPPRLATAPKAGTPRVLTVAERLFQKSDLPVDPKTRVGKLKNGMTYVIYPNATPSGAVSMRLRIDAGAINEGPNDHGLAHFLEHMAFSGSKHIPEGELVRMLERNGLQFGADTNAFTSVTQTYYKLDLPRSDKNSLNTALFILSETAHGLSLDPEILNREREVVLAELRTTDTAQRRAYMKRVKSLLAGQAYVDHEVIGTTQSLRALTAPQLRRFYETFYRPDRTTLVVVGDVQPAVMEALIAEKFNDWKPAAPPPPPTNYGAYKPKGFALGSHVEPGISPFLSLSWFRPYDETVATREVMKKGLMDALIVSIIERRLGSVNSNYAPYELVAFDQESYTHGAYGLTVSMLPKKGQQTYAVTRAYETLRQFATHADSGAYDVDFQDAVAKINLLLKNGAAGQNTRETKELADEWMSDIDDGNPLMSPGQTFALWKSLKPEITLPALKARMNDWLAQDGPSVYNIGDKPTELVEGNLRQHWTLAGLMAVSEPAAFVKTPWPFKDFGPASPLVSETVDPVLGFTRLTYASGLKVNVKQTPFKSDEVLIRVRMAGGTSRLSPADPVPAMLLKFYDYNGLLRSGVGELGGGEVDDALIGKTYSLNYRLSEGYTDINGETARDDVLTQAQLIMAFLKEPRFDDYSVRAMLSQYDSYYRRIQTSPEELVVNQWWTNIYPGDQRYALPTPASTARVTGDNFRHAMAQSLALRPLEVTFVGDMSVAEVKAVVAQTFAGLVIPAAPGPEPVTPAPVITPQKAFDVTHEGKTGQAAVMIVWPTEGFYSDLKRSRGLRLLGELLTSRLNTILREKEGLAYSPYAYWTGSNLYDQGFLRAMAGINPEQEARFFTTLNRITDELKTQPVTADELLRARKPLIESRLADEKGNDFWLNMVSSATYEPKTASVYKDYETQMMSYSPEDLQILARTYLAADHAVTLIARPKAENAGTPAAHGVLPSKP